jgi:putative ABC transport system permease protein
MNKMIVSNLAYRPVRSIISILAVAIEVTLILLIVGVALGMLNDQRERQKGIGGDVLVRPPGSSMLNAFNTASVPVKVADILARQAHVTAVAPVVTHVSSGTGFFELIYGVDLNDFERVGGPFRYIKGGPFQGPYDVVVDDVFAAANKTRVGAKLELFNHEFHVSGIVEHGRGARRFIPIKTMQELIDAPGKASAFYVKLDDSKQADPVAKVFKEIPGMSEYTITPMHEYLSLLSVDNIPMLATFINLVIGISVVIGFMVIFQSMYTAVMERTREIGILKSLGASKLYIVRVILRETLLLAIAGIIVGILMTFAAGQGIHYKIRTLPVEFPLRWMLWATIIAIVSSLLGALYPAFKAAEKDPIDALAYE